MMFDAGIRVPKAKRCDKCGERRCIRAIMGTGFDCPTFEELRRRREEDRAENMRRWGKGATA